MTPSEGGVAERFLRNYPSISRVGGSLERRRKSTARGTRSLEGGRGRRLDGRGEFGRFFRDAASERKSPNHDARVFILLLGSNGRHLSPVIKIITVPRNLAFYYGS